MRFACPFAYLRRLKFDRRFFRRYAFARLAQLRIDRAQFFVYARERFARGSSSARGGQRRAPEPPPRDKLAEAYSILGVSASASDDAVKKAYREKAKKYHPDTLRAQGLPDEMVGKATEQMARVNAAWAEIKAARGI